jgi:hypothetical protein
MFSDLERVEDWSTALALETNKISGKPHAWGQNDCAIFAANAIRAMTGQDPMKGIRGRYKTAIGAARVIKNDGFQSLAAYVSALFPEIEPADAKRGDLVLCEGPFGDFLAVRERSFAIGPGFDGVEQIEPRQFKRAWRVG